LFLQIGEPSVSLDIKQGFDINIDKVDPLLKTTLSELKADHITPWSIGGKTLPENL